MGYIISYGYSQGAIWFYNLRAPQICFQNVWDQKIDQATTRDRCVLCGRSDRKTEKNAHIDD